MSLQVGVVGAGSMGANHLRVLRDLGDDAAQLVAVAEPDDSARERASAALERLASPTIER